MKLTLLVESCTVSLLQKVLELLVCIDIEHEHEYQHKRQPQHASNATRLIFS
jgi:hypothetical protein